MLVALLTQKHAHWHLRMQFNKKNDSNVREIKIFDLGQKKVPATNRYFI